MGFPDNGTRSSVQTLQGDYDDSAAKAATLKKRIAEMDQIATDLFNEWEKEDASISTPSLREQSQQQLRDTQDPLDRTPDRRLEVRRKLCAL